MAPKSDILKTFFPSIRHCWELLASELCAPCCVEELARRLPHIAADSWPQRFALGGVYVGGRRAQPDTQLRPPVRLEYYEPRTELELLQSCYPAFSPDWILFHDPDLGVAFKPAGLPSTAPRDQDLFHLQGYLSSALGAPVHLPSRLDVGVSGVVLFTRSGRMHRHAQRAYETRRIERVYLAEVNGAPTWDALDCTLPIARDPAHPVLRRVVSAGGEAAHTHLVRLTTWRDPQTGAARSLLKALPRTGRTHQIRLHCAALGIPLVGDPFYGTFENNAPGAESALRLASFMVRFFHPYAQRQAEYTIPAPLQMPWVIEALKRLGGAALLVQPLGGGGAFTHR